MLYARSGSSGECPFPLFRLTLGLQADLLVVRGVVAPIPHSSAVSAAHMAPNESDKLRREAEELQALARRLMEQAETLIATSKELEKKIKKR